MAISNSEFNFIMREYEERRYKAKHELDKRVSEVYSKIPRIKEIQNEISSVAVKSMRSRLGDGDAHGLSSNELHKKIAELTEEKMMLLEKNGYGRDYLQLQYQCKECKDTGYVESEKCHCLKEKITELLYSRSNLKDILKKENFDTFDISLYSENKVDKLTGDSAVDNIRKALIITKKFVKDFDTGFQNIFIYGETGVGKTFLTNCIAKELMDKGKSVIYISAIRMFEVLADVQFGKKSADDFSGVDDFNNCDLLIIDDLGTELVNTFTTSALFNCINERFMRKKPVIISTNLSIGDIRDMYSERVFSRIMSNFTMLKIFGDDLRIVTSLGLTNS